MKVYTLYWSGPESLLDSDQQELAQAILDGPFASVHATLGHAQAEALEHFQEQLDEAWREKFIDALLMDGVEITDELMDACMARTDRPQVHKEWVEEDGKYHQWCLVNESTDDMWLVREQPLLGLEEIDQ